MANGDWHEWWDRDRVHQLRVLLLQIWDPIGVTEIDHDILDPTKWGEVEGWEAEYDAYIPAVTELLHGPDATNEIAVYLGGIRTRNMAVRPRPEDDRRAAEAIVAWYEQAYAP
ncbi:hypothetical protein HJD18_03390 [Thermoleophilia bacterium SCSIO 60948]|nr:hypothetical protein HJD18_03390 [Thermoleophilia bacterium SCSIO 60948]